jgi:GH25 family lysozyme M1 (1,4-beta-N-acetylmuramidase)
MRYGVDLSHWNKVNWSKLKTDFVIYKCTQGTSYLDPTYKTARDSWKGIFGSYHFATGTDPIKEANWYLKNSNENFCVLDWEIDHADPVKWCSAFINHLRGKGKHVWFYTNDARAVKYPWPKDWTFWIARYGINDGTPNKKPAFKGWSAWQYTSRGTCPGVTGNVDLNVAEEWALPNPPEAPELPPEPFKPEVGDTIPPSDISSPQVSFWTILWQLLKNLFKP